MFDIAIPRSNRKVWQPGVKILLEPDVDEWLWINAGPQLFSTDISVSRDNGWHIKNFRTFHSVQINKPVLTKLSFVRKDHALLFKLVWL